MKLGWNEFETKWRDCQQCSLCETRRYVALARGCIPCNLLFIGEAPGVNEDRFGQPFVGPAGKYLDQQIEAAATRFELPVGYDQDGGVKTLGTIRLGFTNIVGCLPIGEDGNKTHEPPKDAIEACVERLSEQICLSDPYAIIYVGALATKWVPKTIEVGVKAYSITHPAAILRAHEAQKPLMFQRNVVGIIDAIEDTPWLDRLVRLTKAAV